jgi:hypothetical protein
MAVRKERTQTILSELKNVAPNDLVKRQKLYESLISNNPDVQEYKNELNNIQAAIKKQKMAENIAKDEGDISKIERRLKERGKKIERYYGTFQQIGESVQDISFLETLMAKYTDSKEPKEITLRQRARNLVTKVSEQARQIFASATEEQFVKNGYDVKIKAVGKEKTQLRVSFVLMSKPRIYQFQNSLGSNLGELGFTKVIYTNGLSGSLGETWTYDLGE